MHTIIEKIKQNAGKINSETKEFEKQQKQRKLLMARQIIKEFLPHKTIFNLNVVDKKDPDIVINVVEFVIMFAIDCTNKPKERVLFFNHDFHLKVSDFEKLGFDISKSTDDSSEVRKQYMDVSKMIGDFVDIGLEGIDMVDKSLAWFSCRILPGPFER